MLHRHLTQQQFTLAAIDDIIARGKRREYKMIWVGLLFTFGGVVNILSAKKKRYSLQGRVWNKLYGGTFTRNYYFVSGFLSIIIGIYILIMGIY